ncbi:MAG: hypothetical protein FJ387_10045 [Verrucomicrobia bacterium]|nr:hypothetical protein [Verrucomicrobiota bacterium]
MNSVCTRLPPGGRSCPWALALMVVLLAAGAGCSVRRAAVNQIGNALAAGGATFARDDDPELVRAAVPFSLKLMESLLAESPRHKGLLFAASSGFTQYAYAFVQQDADELELRDVQAAAALRARAQRLYLRARDYGLRGLEVSAPGFTAELRAHPEQAARRMRRAQVPLLYWTGLAWAAAVSVSKDNPEVIADLPIAEALIDRALELDESFEHGAIHTFLIAYEMSRQGATGTPAARARHHFERAVQLSQGQHTGPFVALAEAVAIPQQDRAQFDDLIGRALAIDPNARPDWRLVNLILQRRARWLRERADDLILPPLPPDDRP